MPKTVVLIGRVEVDPELVQGITTTGTRRIIEGTIKWFGGDVREKIEFGDQIVVPDRDDLPPLEAISARAYPGEDGVSYVLIKVRTS